MNPSDSAQSPVFAEAASFVDVSCPSCGAKLRGQLVDPWTMPDGSPGPNIFTSYPHRARDWKGWCKKGTWTATVPSQLELGAA